ncbi:S-layer homology domain-containing protein [Cohnella sp. 56]|uniref:S-layer homology domain-containing protein n=1 Tax=Cohnella sp. 56 TaxID=3113722 RepID=UPI0030E93106
MIKPVYRCTALLLSILLLLPLFSPGYAADAASPPPSKVADGEYDVPFLILTDNKDEPSVAMGYTASPVGKLIAHDGTYKLVVQFINYDWFEYWGSLTKGKPKGKNTSDYTPAEVLEKKDGEGARGPLSEPTPVEGYYGTVSFPLDDLLQKQEVLMHIVTKNLYIGGMPFAYDNWYNAQVRIDTSNLPLVPQDGEGGGTAPQADAEALARQISAAEEVYAGSRDGYGDGAYVPGARASLKLALDAAAQTANDPSATAQQIADAYRALTQALANLERYRVIVDRSALGSAIADGIALQPTVSDYGTRTGDSRVYAAGENPLGTKATIGNLLSAAQAVYVKADPTQQEVDDQRKKLDDYWQTVRTNRIAGVPTRLIVLDSPAPDAGVSPLAAAFETDAEVLKVNTKREYSNITLKTASSALAPATYLRPGIDGSRTFIETPVTPLKYGEDAISGTYTVQLQNQTSTFSSSHNSGFVKFSFAYASNPSVVNTVYLSFNGYLLDALNLNVGEARTLHDRAVSGDLAGQFSAPAASALQSAIDSAAATGHRLAATKVEIADAGAALNAAVQQFLASRWQPLYYTAADAGADAFSLADAYFDKPAYMSERDGIRYAALTLRHSSEIVSFMQKLGDGSYAEAETIYADAAEDVRIVLVRAPEAGSLAEARLQLAAPGRDDVRTLDIRLNFSGVDNAALAAAVAEASALLAGAKVGVAPGQHRAEALSLLQAAIGAAGRPAAKPEGTQAESDAALAALAEAIAAFRAAAIPSGDPADLLALAGRAEAAHASAVAGDDAGEYPAATIDALGTALAAAKALLAREASADEIAAAYAALSSAFEAFKAAVGIAGDPAALKALAASAQAAYDAAVEGTSAGSYPAGAKAKLGEAIAAARATLGKASSAAVIGRSASELSRALDAFLASKLLASGSYTVALKSADAELAKHIDTSGGLVVSGGSARLSLTPKAGVSIVKLVNEATGRTIYPVGSTNAPLIAALDYTPALLAAAADVPVAFELDDLAVPYTLYVKDAEGAERGFALRLGDIAAVPGQGGNDNPSGTGGEGGNGSGAGNGSQANGNGAGADGSGGGEPAADFADTANHWAREAIRRAVGLGIAAGYGDGTFRPGAEVTRGEFAVFLSRALKSAAAGEGAAALSDLDETPAWAKAHAAAVTAAGWMQVYEDGSFRAGRLITRAELAVIVARAAGLDAADDASGGIGAFADGADIPAWAKPGIAAAAAAGLVQGIGNGRFGPAAHATRAEALTLIMRLLDYQAARER